MAKDKTVEKVQHPLGSMGLGPVDTPLPATKDNEGNLLEVPRKSFPRSKEGKIAFCKYMQDVFVDRASFVKVGMTPKAIAERELARQERRIAKLKEKLAGM